MTGDYGGRSTVIRGSIPAPTIPSREGPRGSVAQSRTGRKSNHGKPWLGLRQILRSSIFSQSCFAAVEEVDFCIVLSNDYKCWARLNM